MTQHIKEILASRGIHLNPDELTQVEAQWNGIQELKKGLDHVNLADAGIALRNIPGGDHV